MYQNGDINSSSFALGVRRLGFAPAAARHRGPTRCAPQARKRSWPKVTTHMAGARSQADLASQGAGVRRRVVCLVGESRSRPSLPRNGIRRGRASLRCGRSTPIESRCPPLPPAFLGVRVPADGMAIAGQAI
ncbi:hypothetical protein FIM10_19560 [Sphingomonadales bacterium 56]|uniref:Uncharacterized protein n=2 Tax=Sphingomonadaceae TaxID=41297 RepID=A0A2S8B0I1_9SPHN|nr:hypothetical protein G432_21405 [Sphingomonas sp. MM-1]AMK20499.1 hypothetical protein K663_20713 [Sphingobium sp. MI1205]AMK26728.1 hypothetical protein K426_29180 [Sphingobium sp. TKS]MBY2930879.1 hypothetical protein [Sphingomonadales bacterium 56]MBY2960957.1 hypothetical protein [Sphingomonadales bacterium 58]PQM25789.1 hypothetical protein CVO77_20375 [Sphingopyxis lindanitolerans]BAI99181.1 hypothetical protein SJA_P2-00050 [Sphingobium indicum UT26S]